MHQVIKADLKSAMLAHDELRVRVLRSLLAAFTNELVTKRQKPDGELAESDCVQVLRRAAKQRNDSIEAYEKGGRPELAAAERAEFTIIESYLPATLSKEAILPIAQAKKTELGISDKSKMGILMGAVMKELGNTANGADVRAVVESLF